MLTFTKLGEYGRLGNQLYQYAALKGIAKKMGLTPKISNLSNKEWHGQKCLLNEFRISCDVLEEGYEIKGKVEEPFPVGYYHKEVENSIKNDFDIGGFFQNTQYFNDVEEDIKKELLPKEHHLDKANEYVDSIRDGRKVVSVHVRRGDNTDGTNPNAGIYGENPLDTDYLWGNYFDKATDYLFGLNDSSKYLFLIFVGGSRTGDDSSDIEWAKKHFDYDGFHISDSNDPITDFSRMICCDVNIISHSSSFGWWSAYLNTNPNKIVIAPQNYHLDNTTQYREGFYPKEWILL